MMKKLMTKFFLIVVMLCAFVGFSSAGETLKLATTTSTYETGLLDYLLPVFEVKNNCKVHVISVGTGKAIKIGENGDVDIILIHARVAEDKFISEGNGVNRRDVMYNDFVILGSAEDPAGIRGLNKVTEAFRKIVKTKSLFVSRGDDSGTHKKELKIWQETGLKPKAGGSYLEVGQGMNQTLRVADEKNAYCLSDRASYLFNKDSLRLTILFEGDAVLLNPYGVIAVSPYKYPHVKYELSMSLIAWLTSPACQQMIAEYEKDGNKLYYPNAVGAAKE